MKSNKETSKYFYLNYKRKSMVHFTCRKLWLYPLWILALYFLSSVFIPYTIIRLGSAVILSIFPFLTTVKLLYQQRQHLLRYQSKVLLQSLCSTIAGGNSLETAFSKAYPILQKAYGEKAIMTIAISILNKKILAGQQLDPLLTELCYQMDYLELLPIMQALSISRIVGYGVLEILRNSCQMFSELISVQNEVNANNAGRNMEALLLCLMPFAITLTLASFTQEYITQAYQSIIGVGLMFLAFTISIVSCALLLSIIGSSSGSNPKKSDNRNIHLPIPTFFIDTVTNFFLKYSPKFLLLITLEYLKETNSESEKAFKNHIHENLSLLIVLTIPLLIFLKKLNLSFLYIFPILISLLCISYHGIKQKSLQRRQQLMEHLPLFLSTMSTLLQSGILLPKSLKICLQAFTNSPIIYQELKTIDNLMLTGLSAGIALEKFSERTPIPEAQAALLLAAKYDLHGGKEILQLLAMQSKSCWNLLRNAARKKKEKESLAMLLPMILDFIAILIVVTAPALLSLKIK